MDSREQEIADSYSAFLDVITIGLKVQSSLGIATPCKAGLAMTETRKCEITALCSAKGKRPYNDTL
jgi:hypothetical protein